MSYKIKLDIFQGPLDLLLFLIRREKLDIYDIPIARITQQYLEYMELMKLLNLDIAGEFLVMASTLMYIKSKMLLPQDEIEEETEDDPRATLVEKLLEYKKFKNAAEHLQMFHEEHKGVYPRKGMGDSGVIFTEDGSEYFETSLFDLISAFKKVLNSVPKDVFHEVIKDKFTVSDKIHDICHMLTEKPKLLFSSLFRLARSKDEIIAIFLALLELIKGRNILVVQKDFFEEIFIIRNIETVSNSLDG